MQDIRKVRHLVLSGGGFKGFAYIGAFAALRKSKGIDWGAGMPRLASVCGCSIGALFAAAIALGFSVPELEDILASTDLRKIVSLSFLPGSVALDSGRGLRDLLEDLISRKTRVSATLKELQTELRIAVVDLEAQELRLLDKSSAPDVKIVDALMASMALPPIFPPVDIQGHLCADGGLMNFFPIQLATASYPLHEVLGFRLQSKPQTDCDLRREIANASFPIATYLKRVYDVAVSPYLDACWAALTPELQARCVTLCVPDVHLVEFGFGAGGDLRADIVKAGKQAIEEECLKL